MSAISAASSAPPPPPPGSNFTAIRQAFGQLTTALQSGDLSSAQSAFASIGQAGGANSNGPFGAALQQIGDALQSGNLGQAQQALDQLQQQMQAARGHHHHHADKDGDSDQTQAATGTPPAQSSDPTGATGSAVDVTA